jgi:uncharacterized integral membrane protein
MSAIRNGTSPKAPAQPATDGGTPARTLIPHTRAGGLWASAVAFAVVLLILVIFLLQNGQRTEVSFFGARGHLPLGLAMLLSAVFGVLLVALPGTARIVQLRLLNRRRARRAAPPADPADPADAEPAAEPPS